MTTIPKLIERLDNDARQALEMGLGEALRIGQFWLGVEFLLMGLSRQPGSGLCELLESLKVAPGELRGELRNLVPVLDPDWRAGRGSDYHADDVHDGA